MTEFERVLPCPSFVKPVLEPCGKGIASPICALAVLICDPNRGLEGFGAVTGNQNGTLGEMNRDQFHRAHGEDLFGGGKHLIPIGHTVLNGFTARQRANFEIINHQGIEVRQARVPDLSDLVLRPRNKFKVGL